MDWVQWQNGNDREKSKIEDILIEIKPRKMLGKKMDRASGVQEVPPRYILQVHENFCSHKNLYANVYSSYIHNHPKTETSHLCLS